MTYDYQRVKRLPVDSRIVNRINRTPKLMAEQGPGYMQAYGGGQQYMAVAKLTANERMAFFAIQDGFTTAEDIELATGMDVSDAAKALTGLTRKGLVTSEKQEVVK